MYIASSEIPEVRAGGSLIESRLGRALKALFPVNLQPGQDVHAARPAQGDRCLFSCWNQENRVLRKVVIDQSAPELHPSAAAWQLRFADHPALDRSLRGRAIAHKPLPVFRAVALQEGDVVLAACAEEPVWVLRTAHQEECEITSLAPPEFEQSESIIDHLNGDQFLPLLPVINFLKRAVCDAGWQYPPPRACMMFDDPNLHWPSYGFVSYPRIVESARRAVYHATFATIPMDGWYTHPGAAALFRDHPRHISLLIHGNNHTYAELACPRSAESASALIAQALSRVSSIERRAGVRVDRVMAAPHGACLTAIMACMLSQGIEGAFVSPWSLRLWNQDAHWPAELGGPPAEMVNNAFPAAPRFGLSADCEGSAVLAALLGRPIVPFGHHGVLGHGIDLLEAVAAMINGLGEVEWMNPESIIRRNFLTQCSQGVLHVRPYSANFSVRVPSCCNAIVLDPAAGWEDKRKEIAYLVSNPATGARLTVAAGVPLPAIEGHTWEFTNALLGGTRVQAASGRSPLSWAMARRIICETRDRLAPVRRSLQRCRTGKPVRTLPSLAARGTE